MRLLLTSAGIRTASMSTALQRLLRKPFARSRVTFVVTAALAQPGPHDWLIDDLNRLYALGWADFTVLDLNSAPASTVLRRLAAADLIYASGGNATISPDPLRRLGCPVYAIDDTTALCVTGDRVDVISDGHWQLIEPPGQDRTTPSRPAR
jgi:hypothetical protein